jgi:hypothetical protein
MSPRSLAFVLALALSAAAETLAQAPTAAPAPVPPPGPPTITRLAGDLYKVTSLTRGSTFVVESSTVFLATPDGIILGEPDNTQLATFLKDELARRFGVPGAVCPLQPLPLGSRQRRTGVCRHRPSSWRTRRRVTC